MTSIQVTAKDMIQMSLGRVGNVEYEPSDVHEDAHHSTCLPGLGVGELCAYRAKITFVDPPQIYIVTGYDPETKTWTAQWPD